MKVYLDTIGCRLNQAEIETMARQFRALGHEIVPQPGEAEVAVVNTCAVTGEAVSDSRGRVRHAARLGAEEVVVTGCWATLEPGAAGALPGVSRVVPNSRKESLVVESLPPDERRANKQAFDAEPISRVPLPGLHRRTRAFIKVQDGCDNHCTFCVTTVARGPGRSRSLSDVILDIHSALAGGAKEVVLTGVHLGSWGQDLIGSARLRDLTATILRETDVPRLRLSSLEPWDLDADFFSLWRNPRLMPHLHLPLQSGSASTLKRMARKTTPRSFRLLVGAARRAIPGLAVTTDLIAGFPGETGDEFAESLAFVREMEFAGGHVFTYSPRPGTGAARLPAQIRPEIRKTRNHVLQEALQESAHAYRNRFVGSRFDVLWESASGLDEQGWQMEGLTPNYLRVSASASAPRWNEIDPVELTGLTKEGLRGVIRDSG
ncbi:MAG: MiaB/RimO family radical SAM methylthiotransferase [Bacteroidota bacterium]